MHAAGVLGDIAADRAGDLRGRIRRVIKALRLDRLADREIGDARLHPGAAVLIVDLENAVELAHREQDAVLERHGAARKRGAAAARHDLDVHVLRERQDRRDFRDALGQRDDERQRAIHGEGVAIIGAPRRFVSDDALRPEKGAKPGDDFVAPREDLRLGGRHEKGHGFLLRHAGI